MILVGEGGNIYHAYSGHLIAAGVMSGQCLSGVYLFAPGWNHQFKFCTVCKCELIGEVRTVTTGVSGFAYQTCWKCAGFNYPQGYTLHYEHGIRDSVPFASGTPSYMIADWLEENERKEAAEFMRNKTP